MPPRARKIAVILGAAAIATGAGVGVASQSSSTAATSATAAGQRGPGGPGGMDTAALAKRLGVTEAKLRTALEASRPSGAAGGGKPPSGSQPPSGTQDPSGRQDEMAASLAKQLGLSTAKVKAALAATAPSGRAS